MLRENEKMEGEDT